MTTIHWLIAAALAAAPEAPAAPAEENSALAAAERAARGEPPAASQPRPGEIAKAQAEAIAAQCGARKFETTVESNNAGKLRRAKIMLCAKPGDSDAQWVATLEKAAAQIAASAELSPEAKAKVTAEIKLAISQARAQPAPQGVASIATSPQVGRASALPVARPAKPAAPLRAMDALVATVPPLPPRPPAAKPAPAVQPMMMVAAPRLTILCPPPGEPGAATSCTELAADTSLVIRADEDLKTKVSIRFVREGDPRGGIALGAMRRGQMIRTRLPRRVCAGVVRSNVEMQTVVIDPKSRVEQVADTQGPLVLRC